MLPLARRLRLCSGALRSAALGTAPVATFTPDSTMLSNSVQSCNLLTNAFEQGSSAFALKMPADVAIADS